MNGSAARIPLVYALLLSLTVTMMSLAFVAPSYAAGPYTYRSTTTSPQPQPSRTTDGGGDVVPGDLTEQKNTDSNDAPSGSTTVPSSKDPVDKDGSGSTGTGSTDGGKSDGVSSDNGTVEQEPSGGTDSDSSPAPQPDPDSQDGAVNPPPGNPPPGNPPPRTGDVAPEPSEPASKDPAEHTDPAAPTTPSDPSDPPDPAEPAPAPLGLDPDAVRKKVVAGSKISTKLQVSGGTGDSVFRVVPGALPPGLTLDSNTGRISGTVEQVGEHTFTVEVVSGTHRASHSYTIVVKERPLDIEEPHLEPARAGEKYEAVVLHTQGGEGPFTYRLKGSALVGSKPNPAPVQGSNWELMAPHKVSETLMGSSKLLDPGPTTQDVTDSKSFGSAKGPSQLGNLPVGMRLEEGVLTGKPEAYAAGTYKFTVVSTDRYGSTAEEEMTITVLSDSEPVLLPDGDASGSTSPAQLADRDPDDASSAAAGTSDAGTGPAPLLLGMVLLGVGAALVFLRRRFFSGAHQ